MTEANQDKIREMLVAEIETNVSDERPALMLATRLVWSVDDRSPDAAQAAQTLRDLWTDLVATLPRTNVANAVLGYLRRSAEFSEVEATAHVI